MSASLVFSSVVTKSHLRFARALRQTVAEHHPTVPHFVLLLDATASEEMPESVAAEIYVPLDLVVTDSSERQRLAFRYDALELSCAMKPLFARYLFDEQQATTVAYFDCDMTLHAPLPASSLPRGDLSVVLTPHWLSGTAAALEASWLMYGAFNAGYFSVRNDRRGREFLDFWWERCRRYCVNDFSEGLFVDQAWLNIAPILFHDSLSICPHSGMNVSWWNLHERGVHFDNARVVTSAGEPLVLLHWSQVQFGNDGRIFRHDSALDPTRHPEVVKCVRELHRRFAQLVSANASSHDRQAYRYGTFSDGTRILSTDRRAFRHHGEAVNGTLASPFAEPRWFKSRRVRDQLKDMSQWVTGSHKPATALASLKRSGRSWIVDRWQVVRAFLSPGLPRSR